MRNPEEELESLRVISPQASFQMDGPVHCVLLPKTSLTTPTGREVMDAILCVTEVAGYATRLLLERAIPQKANLNWQTIMMLARTWHTWSWNHISADQPWIQIFAEHARLLR